jgi:hypothetical protein
VGGAGPGPSQQWGVVYNKFIINGGQCGKKKKKKKKRREKSTTEKKEEKVKEREERKERCARPLQYPCSDTRVSYSRSHPRSHPLASHSVRRS